MEVRNYIAYLIIGIVTRCAIARPTEGRIVMGAAALKALVVGVAGSTIGCFTTCMAIGDSREIAGIGKMDRHGMTNLTDPGGGGPGLDETAVGIEELNRFGGNAIPDQHTIDQTIRITGGRVLGLSLRVNIAGINCGGINSAFDNNLGGSSGNDEEGIGGCHCIVNQD